MSRFPLTLSVVGLASRWVSTDSSWTYRPEPQSKELLCWSGAVSILSSSHGAWHWAESWQDATGKVLLQVTNVPQVRCCRWLTFIYCWRIEMPFELWTQVGPRNHVLDGGPDPPMHKGQFWGGRGRPIVKYRDTLTWAVHKRLNRSRCRLGCGLLWVQWSVC